MDTARFTTSPLSWTAGIVMIVVLCGLSAVGFATDHPVMAGAMLGAIGAPVGYLIFPRLRRTESSG